MILISGMRIEYAAQEFKSNILVSIKPPAHTQQFPATRIGQVTSLLYEDPDKLLIVPLESRLD